MKQHLFILSFLVSLFAYSQSNTSLLDHYKEYYNQMRTQGDVQGVINALTHLNILSPNQARKDTLAVLYMNEGKHIQALNTIGIDRNENDSDMAVEVKAMSLQVLNQIERSVEHYEELYRRKPSPLVAYELADMKIQLDDLFSLNLTSPFKYIKAAFIGT